MTPPAVPADSGPADQHGCADADDVGDDGGHVGEIDPLGVALVTHEEHEVTVEAIALEPGAGALPHRRHDGVPAVAARLLGHVAVLGDDVTASGAQLADCPSEGGHHQGDGSTSVIARSRR